MITDLYWQAVSFFLSSPLAAFAQSGQGTGGNGQGGNPGAVTSLDLLDPLKGLTLQQLATRIIEGLLLLAIPVVAIMVIIGAFYIITSGGNPGRRAKGKDYILYAAIGFGILLLAESVALIIQNFITS